MSEKREFQVRSRDDGEYKEVRLSSEAGSNLVLRGEDAEALGAERFGRGATVNVTFTLSEPPPAPEMVTAEVPADDLSTLGGNAVVKGAKKK